MKNTIFSSCGAFSVDSGIFGEEKSLFATVTLPQFGLLYAFKPYSIPYEWLGDNRTIDVGTDEGQPINQQNFISHYHQKNTVQVFGTSLRYRFLINKVIGSASQLNVSSNDGYKRFFEIHPVKELKTLVSYEHIGNDTANKREWDKGSDRGVVGRSIINRLLTCDSRDDNDQKLNASPVTRLYDNVNVDESKGFVGDFQLHKKLIGKTAAASNSDPSDLDPLNARSATTYSATIYPTNSNLFGADQILRNKTSSHVAEKNIVLQQESIQRTIKTLTSKNTDNQRETKAQFNSLQKQLKDVEQLNNQETRRLQQSMLEIKNILSTHKQGVSVPSMRPPTFYGRLK